MKKVLFILSFAVTLLACNTVDVESLDGFKVSSNVQSGDTIVNDTVIIHLKHTLSFNFQGSPDYITFYSGEVHSNYAYAGLSQRNSDSTIVSFSTAIASGNQGTLSLLVSNNFSGTMDSSNVAKANWVVVKQAKYATSATVLSSGNLRLDTISGIDKNKPVYLAFKLTTDSAKTTTLLPRSWTINTFNVKNCFSTPNLAKAGTSLADTVYTLAYDFKTGGFQSVSLKNSLNYWYFTNTKMTFTLNSQVQGSLPDEDWTITRALDMRSVWPDYGTYVKSMNDIGDITSYAYTYKKTGLYIATFVAQNINYKGSTKVVRQIPVKVIP